MIHTMPLKRDPRLRALSSEHHDALVLARRARRGMSQEELTREFATLEAHFAIEERVLLPALMRAGRADLAARTLDEHGDIRHALADPARFAELLEAHVRFEERLLFPACEELIPQALDAL